MPIQHIHHSKNENQTRTQIGSNSMYAIFWLVIVWLLAPAPVAVIQSSKRERSKAKSACRRMLYAILSSD